MQDIIQKELVTEGQRIRNYFDHTLSIDDIVLINKLIQIEVELERLSNKK